MPKQSKPTKPSDFSAFAATVFAASATLMDFQEYFETYEDLLRAMFWNPEIDGLIAAEQSIDGRFNGGRLDG